MISILIIISTSWSIKEHMFVFECNIWSINMRWLEGCMFSKWCVKWLHHLPVSNQNWIIVRLCTSACPGRDISWASLFLLAKPTFLNLKTLVFVQFLPLFLTIYATTASGKQYYYVFDFVLLSDYWWVDDSGQSKNRYESTGNLVFCCNIYWWSLNACLDKMPVSSLTMKWGILTVMKLGVHVVDINLAPFPFPLAICFLYWAILPPKHGICWAVMSIVPLASLIVSLGIQGQISVCYHMWYCWNLVAMRADNEILKVLQLKPLPEMTICKYQ